MSYMKKREYKIVPTDSFKIIHNCSGCKCKTNYINTEKFRINANGNNLDVWLIYQCEKCKHTYNLSIYEREKSNKISKKEYHLFLNNDCELAKKYGTDFQFFSKNKLKVNVDEVEYILISSTDDKVKSESTKWYAGDKIIIDNIFALKIRKEKIAAMIFNQSRSQINKLLELNNIVITKKHNHLEISIIHSFH